ncbi:MAG: amidohydrolase family protein [Acidobacteria bacterium]|nr:amidohydrolase family protein [Acidobacteriota bacterium]
MTVKGRREFFKSVAGAAAGMYVMTRGGNADAQAPVARRQVSIGGRRIRVIDVHAHCNMPLGDVVRGTPFENRADADPGLEERLLSMDENGLDMQALSINGFWWYEATDRGLARAICNRQNEQLAASVRDHADRFVAMASVPLQFPDLAAEVLEDAVTRLGARGVTLGGHVNGEDLSLPKFDPFWAKAAEMGELVFMHPGGADNIIRDGAFGGRGDLGNVMGNPLETTYFLSRLIFDGVFDRHPALRVCGAHAGGYLPSYFGRTEAACDVRANADCANTKRPTEYLRSKILVDTMVFSDEGLRHLVAEMGVDQIVYGTDNPFNWPVTVDLVLEAGFLNDAEKEAILGGNLIKLLRIT